MSTCLWNHQERPHLGLMNTISALIAAKEWRGRDAIPFLLGDTLILACDFSGDPKRTRYRAMTIVLADGDYLWLWDELRTRVRSRIFTQPRRLAFKNITEKQRARALVPFLRAANTIPGVVFTLLVSNRLRSIFSPDSESEVQTPRHLEQFFRLDSDTRERLLLLAHITGMLLGGLSKPNDGLLLISDEDSIFANDARHRIASDVISTIASHYLSHHIARAQVATTKSDTGRLDLEDLVAIADLSAGALVETAGLRDGRGGIPRGMVAALDKSLSEKCRAIIAWLAEPWHPLRRWTIRIDATDGGLCRAEWINLIPERPILEYDWTSEASTLLTGWR